MKWFYMVMSFLVKRFAGGAGLDTRTGLVDEIKELIAENAVKIFLAVAAAAILGTLFVAGITITSVNLANQYDLTSAVSMNAVVTVGIVLLAISLIGFIAGYIYSTKHSRAQKKLEEQKMQYHHRLDTFQDAFLLLVDDFIAEREFKREQRYKAMQDKKHSEQQMRH